MNRNIFQYKKTFHLENGGSLPELELAYHTYGTLNAEGNNVIWVCHALTANSDVFDWWEGLFGEDTLYNPKNYFIVCVNNLGSCHGSTGPLSINPHTGQKWYSYFPLITVKDIVASCELLKQHLQLRKLHTVIGGSMGGQIALEWALQNPELCNNLVLLAANAFHSPWGIAFNESQRLAIKADRTYIANLDEGGKKGLAAARSIALLSYRTYKTYDNTQQEENFFRLNNHKASSYQRYQGEKLVKRFNAYSYVTLLNAMDSHHIARNRVDNLVIVLKKIKAKTLVIGLKSDILFPTSEQKFLTRNIRGAEYAEIESDYGHDGFLIETHQISKSIARFYLRQNQFTTHSKGVSARQ